jgi:hypothetical protein
VVLGLALKMAIDRWPWKEKKEMRGMTELDSSGSWAVVRLTL